MKRLKVVLLVLTLVLFSGFAEAAEGGKTSIIIATGGTAGTYYPVGEGLAKLINKNIQNVSATAETGNASAANINLIAEHKAGLALVQNDVAYWGIKGMKPFKKPVTNLRMIASLYPEHLQCITLKNSGIKTFNDIKGKRVSIGAPGSGVTESVGAILSVAGIKYTDMNTDYLDFANTASRMYNDLLDVGFVLAGYPTSAIMGLANNKDIDLVPFDEELLNKLVKAYPYFKKDVVPAGTYKGIDHVTPTPAVMAMLVCDSTMSDALVYSITRVIFENLDELRTVHNKAKFISLSTAIDGASITMHPGAVKYFKEKGVKIPKAIMP